MRFPGRPQTKMVALQSAYNLSCFRICRARLVEEDLVEQLDSLLSSVRSGGESFMQQLAITVSNLALHVKSQPRIIEGGAVGTLCRLFSVGDDRTKQLVGVAMADLAGCLDSQERLVEEGGLTPIVHLANAKNVVLKVKAAAAIMQLSQCVPARPALVKAGAVAALITLSQIRNHNAKRLCSVALCNLVNDVGRRNRKKVELGALRALLSLARSSTVDEQERCAHAMAELSNRKSLAKAMLKANGLETLRTMITASPSPKLVQFCVATLVNLSLHRRSREALVFGDVLPAATEDESKEPSGEEPHRSPRILEILKPLCYGRKIASMPFLLSSVVCHLSYFAPGRVRMVEDGVVSMIAALQSSASSVSESNTRLNLAIAICNLAEDDNARSLMIDQGAVQVCMRAS